MEAVNRIHVRWCLSFILLLPSSGKQENLCSSTLLIDIYAIVVNLKTLKIRSVVERVAINLTTVEAVGYKLPTIVIT